MKIKYIIILTGFLSSCALDEPDITIDDNNFPLRLQIDEEGSDLADAEDYGIEISFADYLGDLPSSPITLTYSLSGEDDFSAVSIDEIIYEYEDDDCVYEREIIFTQNTITIPVDPDLGTVPEAFEIVVAFNLAGDEASDGGFNLSIDNIETANNVVFNDANTFEYEILENDVAGAWVIDLDEASFNQLKKVFGTISSDLADLDYSDITGEVVFEFGFEEMKIEIELIEEEEVSECENGEVETEMESLVIEIEADYDAEDGEIELEGSYFNEDGEELDFLAEGGYSFDVSDNLVISFLKLVDEDAFEDGDELFVGTSSFTLIKD